MPRGLKILMLLSTPLPLRLSFGRHFPVPLGSFSTPAFNRCFLSAVPYSKLGLSIRAAEQSLTQAVAQEVCRDSSSLYPDFKHSCSEWNKLTHHLLARGYSRRLATPVYQDDPVFKVKDLPEQFLKSAVVCLDFARKRPEILRLLTKNYVKTIVENVTPFLFKNNEFSVNRMKLFLSGDANTALEPETAQTIDIMQYLLSYIYNLYFSSNGNQFKADEYVETSARTLFQELFSISGTVRTSISTKTLPLGNEQLSRPSGKSFLMRRGNWICQKCTFVNFARNNSCLECGESRPKRQLTGSEWECPQCDFFNFGKNTSCLRCDCKRPGNIPDGTFDLISHSQQDRMLSRSSTQSGNTFTDGNNKSASAYGRPDFSQLRQNTVAKQGRNYDQDIPIVPLPSDMFKKKQHSNMGLWHLSDKGISSSSNTSDFIDSLFNNSENSRKGNNNKDASLRCSQMVSELENTRNPATSVSNEDFPDIMPTWKGESRFVTSRKRDRSLEASSAYKRRLAMEKANNFDSIPFVPFPPDYFARKDNQPATDFTESITATMDKVEGQVPDSSNSGKSNSKNSNLSHDESASHSSPLPTSTWKESSSYSGLAVNSTQQQLNDVAAASLQQPWGHQDTGNTPSGEYSGKNLEGSCVKEIKPLDMSEEAKAERWFLRSAQIKDILELSQIPNEDFPDIMPLRKDVNRFVVSKRKTPIERRLTSPLYRRNLPVVSSESEKQDSDNLKKAIKR